MKPTLTHGVTFVAGLIVYWLLAGARNPTPDAMEVVGLAVSVFSMLLAWRIYEMQDASQRNFERSQVNVIEQVKTALTEIRESVRYSQGQWNAEIKPMLDALRERAQQGEVATASAIAVLDHAQDELGKVAEAPASTGSSGQVESVAAELTQLRSVLEQIEQAQAAAMAASPASTEVGGQWMRLLEQLNPKRAEELRQRFREQVDKAAIDAALPPIDFDRLSGRSRGKYRLPDLPRIDADTTAPTNYSYRAPDFIPPTNDEASTR